MACGNQQTEQVDDVAETNKQSKLIMWQKPTNQRKLMMWSNQTNQRS